MNEPDEKDAPCWCGRDHGGDDFVDAATTAGHAILAALRIPEMVDALDRGLRRWPWLYRRLGGDE